MDILRTGRDLYYLLLALLLSMSCMGQYLRRLPLPKGYRYGATPYVSEPLVFEQDPDCRACRYHDGKIRLVYKHFSGWRLGLDNYAGRQVTDQLLVAEHGYLQIWEGPHFGARLHYSPKSGLLRLVLRNRVVRFMQKETDDGAIAFEPMHDDGWSVYRSGQYVTVKGPKFCYYFFTPDLGQRWLIGKLHSVQRPELEVTLDYDPEGRPQYLRYPDGQLCTMTYEDTNIRTMTMPNGTRYEFIRDVGMQLTELREYRPVRRSQPRKLEGFSITSTAAGIEEKVSWSRGKKEEMKLVRSWLFENDPNGKIKKYVDACGKAYEVEHTHFEDGKTEIYGMVLKDVTRQRYSFLRHTAKGKTWTYERGEAPMRVPLDEVPVRSTTTLEKVGITFRPTRIESADTEYVMEIDYDRMGRETERKLVNEEGEAMQQLLTDLGERKQVAEREAGTTTTSKDGRTQCNWNVDGILATVTAKGETQVFRFDRLGRMTFAASSKGVAEGWTYDSFSRATQFSRFTATVTDEATGPEHLSWQPAVTVGYFYDGQDRLVEKKQDSGYSLRYTHSCHGVASFVDTVGMARRYYYYENGLLRKCVKEAPASVVSSDPNLNLIQWYKYDEQERLIGLKEKLPDGEKVIAYAYDEKGKRSARLVTGKLTGRDGSEAVVTVSETDPFGETTTTAFNRFGIAIEEPESSPATLSHHHSDTQP